MFDFLSEYHKNFWKMIIIPAFSSTIEMVVITIVLATIFGFSIAVVLLVTNKDGIHPNQIIYQVISLVVNIIRSFPFVILMVFLLPLTKLIMGTSFGVKAAIVPLTIAATAFIARLVENAMKEVDPGLIEAMKSFGISDFQVVFHVILSEAVPAIVSGIVLATIAVLGATAMAGTMGAGGIGSVAITYGYQSFNDEIMYLTAAILVIMVQGIQGIGDWIYRKMK